MTRVTVKNDDNSNQKTEERRHLGQMSMSIGIGCQVEPLPRGGREQPGRVRLSCLLQWVLVAAGLSHHTMRVDHPATPSWTVMLMSRNM
jgi:hypothetical protein